MEYTWRQMAVTNYKEIYVTEVFLNLEIILDSDKMGNNNSEFVESV